jgi:hypothetical protein
MNFSSSVIAQRYRRGTKDGNTDEEISQESRKAGTISSEEMECYEGRSRAKMFEAASLQGLSFLPSCFPERSLRFIS